MSGSQPLGQNNYKDKTKQNYLHSFLWNKKSKYMGGDQSCAICAGHLSSLEGAGGGITNYQPLTLQKFNKLSLSI